MASANKLGKSLCQTRVEVVFSFELVWKKSIFPTKPSKAHGA